MTKPILVCAADLTHLPHVSDRLAANFELRWARPATPDNLARLLPEADAYFAALEVQLTDQLIASAPRLRVIATPSTGLDHLDMAAATARDIVVLELKNERALLDRITATAELTWALVLACARRLPAAFDASRQGRWARDALRGHQIAEKTFGIIGCGRLGTIVADYARAFRMTVLGYDVHDVRIAGIDHVPLDELLARADVVSLHIHLTEANRGFMNRDRLQQMKPGSILVNTSRGAIVDEIALIEVLATGPLASYGTDVIDGEWRDDLDQPPLIRHAREYGNVVITPHIGGITFESQAMAYGRTAEMLIDYFASQTRKNE